MNDGRQTHERTPPRPRASAPTLFYPLELVAAGSILPPTGSCFGGITPARNVARKELVDAALTRAVAAEGFLLTPATDAEWGGSSGYVADPDGYPWEID